MGPPVSAAHRYPAVSAGAIEAGPAPIAISTDTGSRRAIAATGTVIRRGRTADGAAGGSSSLGIGAGSFRDEAQK
ncbi:hypothetical protein GCM10009853_030860 [Glycomyces scopariae]